MGRGPQLRQSFAALLSGHSLPEPPPTKQSQVALVNRRIRQYFSTRPQSGNEPSWLQYPEFPTSEELLGSKTVADATSSSPSQYGVNRPSGPWPSRDEYLETMYRLTRADALHSLRGAIFQIRQLSHATESDVQGNIGIYDKVYMDQIICSMRGLAVRVSFGLSRVGKRIPWGQSKRLSPGTLVVISPAKDGFQTQVLVAFVAARPLEFVQANPPKIDLFFADDETMPLDPAEEFLMVEVKGALYDASRYTLLALQQHAHERSNFDSHLVDVKPQVSNPACLESQPELDLSCLYLENDASAASDTRKCDIINDWMNSPPPSLDHSQSEALRRILTKSLAIVQGPPGTGKTYVSVQALKVMLKNFKPGEPPIVVACQTNHAVDQILRHVAQFEPDFIRLGAQSKDEGVVKARTLYEVRTATGRPTPRGCAIGAARKRLEAAAHDLGVLLRPLCQKKEPMDAEALFKYGLLTRAQVESLRAGAARWVREDAGAGASDSPFFIWLSDLLVPTSYHQTLDLSLYDFEEADLEEEIFDEQEAEGQAQEDESDYLRGSRATLYEDYTCSPVRGINSSKPDILLKEQDMWRISERHRPAIYLHLQARLKAVIAAVFRAKAREYRRAVEERRLCNLERDEVYLRDQKIIGMTTTGLSKYRGLLAALRPRVVLIEEAGEILEAPVLVGCMPTVQQLILVGDHQQLRPQCQNRAHEGEPFNLNISLFERMMRNGVESTTLQVQRRMIPEIRALLAPIYGDIIQDHAVVTDLTARPSVPGMNGVNSLFFTHEWAEQRDNHMSAFNSDEADMVVGLFSHLVHHGLKPSEITILTFYNGQRKQIIRLLRSRQQWAKMALTVVTVDSYQGEENKVVILSLVRSNQIGFLSVANRICVALSRAQCGFYMFGNGRLLYKKSKIWKKVLEILGTERQGMRRLLQQIPLYCAKHDEHLEISVPGDWNGLSGGCRRDCTAKLPLCGHSCPLKCHPFEHDLVRCARPCQRALACGHGTCKNLCGEVCACKECEKARLKAESKFAADVFDLDALMRTNSDSARPASSSSGPMSGPADDQHRLVLVDDLLIDIDDGTGHAQRNEELIKL